MVDSASRMTAEQGEALRECACAARERARLAIARSTELLERAAIITDAAQLRLAVSAESCRELRGGVGAYVVALRQLDTPPERAIMHAKMMVADALPLRDRRAQAVTSLVVQWAIEAYYAA